MTFLHLKAILANAEKPKLTEKPHPTHKPTARSDRSRKKKRHSVLPTIHYLSTERREQLNTLLKGEYFSLVPQTMKVHVFPRVAVQLKWE